MPTHDLIKNMRKPVSHSFHRGSELSFLFSIITIKDIRVMILQVLTRNKKFNRNLPQLLKLPFHCAFEIIEMFQSYIMKVVLLSK